MSPETDEFVSVRQNIRNHSIVLEEDDLPRFLWERETVNIRDLKTGFLRGEILVRVCSSYRPIHPMLTGLHRRHWPSYLDPPLHRQVRATAQVATRTNSTCAPSPYLLSPSWRFSCVLQPVHLSDAITDNLFV